MTTEQRIEKLFNLLDDWRKLPAYQLERRADIFFATYLPDIIKNEFGVDIEFIVPEFPVRLGHVFPKNQINNPSRSYKIDYVAVSNKSNKVFLIELKTDDSSVRESQIHYYNRVRDENIKYFVDGILEIYKDTKAKKKYDHLLSHLSQIGWIDTIQLKNKIDHNYEIEIVYIQPNDDKSGRTIITFEKIANELSSRQDELTKRFVQSLQRWIINPNN